MMIESKNLLSETAVNEFIEAVKIVANVSGSKIRISRHDEALMRMHLTAKPVDKTGIAVVIKPRRFDISSNRFEASWSRR